MVAGWRLIAERHHLTVYDRDGNQPLKGVVVPPLAGWLQAYEAGRHRAALIAGTGIGSTPASLACWPPSAAGESLVPPCDASD